MGPCIDALLQIPLGQTRSFLELAAMAGRPGGARAAGRAIASCRASSKLPWHRVVRADGRSNDATNALQLRRLRHEGARPKAREPIETWAECTGANFVGYLSSRRAASSVVDPDWIQRRRRFSGGNFYVVDELDGTAMTEIAVDEGDVVLFATRERRVEGRQIPLRHGMTLVTKGTRYRLGGLVFHLAE